MSKVTYLVLSDKWEDRQFSKLRTARLEHAHRLRAGEQGCQLWREYATFDHLILNTEGEDVEKEKIYEHYPGIREINRADKKRKQSAAAHLAAKKPVRNRRQT